MSAAEVDRPVDRDPHAVVLAEVASLTTSLLDVVGAAIARSKDTESASILVAAEALCQRIGFLADEALDCMRTGQVRGGARDWMVSPQAAHALQQLGDGATQ